MNRVSVSCKSSFPIIHTARSTASIVERHVSSIVPAIFSPPEHVAGQIHDSSLDYQFIQTTRPSSLSDLDRLSMYRVQHPHLPAPTCISPLLPLSEPSWTHPIARSPPPNALDSPNFCMHDQIPHQHLALASKTVLPSRYFQRRAIDRGHWPVLPRFPMLPTPTCTIPSLRSLPCRLPQTVHPTTLSLIHSHKLPDSSNNQLHSSLSLLLSLTLPTHPTH
jgi:hypothetical protein